MLQILPSENEIDLKWIIIDCFINFIIDCFINFIIDYDSFKTIKVDFFSIFCFFCSTCKIRQNYFSARPPLFLKLNLLKVHNDSTPKICALPRAQPSPNPRPSCLPLGCGANVGGGISLIGACKHFFGGWVEKGEEKGEKGGEANVHTYVYKPVSVHTLIHIRRYFFCKKSF